MLTRREFGGMALAMAAAGGLRAAGSIDDTLRSGIAKRGIPCAAAMVARGSRITYQGAFGRRDESGVPIRIDSIFSIASMTKAVTSVAAMQLVEQGKVTLDEPVSKHLPQIGTLQVLDHFEGDMPVLRPPKTPVTLRHLLTHTSGLCYSIWDEDLTKYQKVTGTQQPGTAVAPLTPLMFDPGTHWQYGTGVDFAGKLVEKISGLSLEEYFQKNILQPLGMEDTSFNLPASKFERWVSMYNHQPDGSFKTDKRALPAPPKEFNGGGGLYSTCADYTKFMQMILREGAREGGSSRGEILKASTVRKMSTNQIGSLSAGKMKTLNPAVSADVNIDPGHLDGYGLGFLINADAYDGGRSAGSLAWAGIGNTFYWIDPQRNLCAVIMMQFLPFVDPDAVTVLGEFERAVYVA